MLAFRPGLFMPAETVAARMWDMVAAVRGNPVAEGVEQILIPGEPESRLEAQRLAEGIPYRRDDLAPIVEVARAKGVALPAALA
jgi:LDH2 family malate/lactate/ureidoglycolate dehydrogenase